MIMNTVYNVPTLTRQDVCKSRTSGTATHAQKLETPLIIYDYN